MDLTVVAAGGVAVAALLALPVYIHRRGLARCRHDRKLIAELGVRCADLASAQRDSEAMLRAVLDSASDVAIIATDPDLTIRMFNAGAERLLGYSRDEVVGQTTLIVIHDPQELHERGVELGARLGHSVADGAALVEPSTLQQPREWTYLRKNGGRATFSLVMNAMRADNGKLLGYVGVARDVTRRKRYEKSMRDATLKAEQTSRAKSDFLANMSHEIRSPMNAVIGLSYLLGRTALDAEQASFLAQIKLASKSLLGIINAVLDLSKIEAGELIVERAAFSPNGLLLELADVMALQADAKGIGFKIDAPDDLPEALAGDAMRLNQILTNLLSNAIKFTDHGHVALRVHQLQANDRQVRLGFVVHDSGIGIAPEVQARLFAPFAQADASITRRFGGTGLGLSIVKRLTTAMGGTVSLESTPGVGSEFRVELPFDIAVAEAAPAASEAVAAPGECALLGVRVLVVDDSEINSDVAKRILELEGARVRLAANGLEAVEVLRQQADAFDVVLMDVQMPVLDGHEATHRIRVDLGLVCLPVIALTAGALSSERQRAAAAGMDDFIIKPFDVQALVGGILRHVRPPASAAAAPPGEAADAAAPPATGLAPIEWPQIDGIDTLAARTRLSDDLDLFCSILERLLDEFAQIAIPAAATDPLPLAAHGGRMHKLKGAAGTIGAKAVQQLAGDAEAACGAGRRELAAQLAQRCAVQLQRIRHSAQPTFDAARAKAALYEQADLARAASLTNEVGIAPQVLADLIDLLRQQSFAALASFKGNAVELRRLLGNGSFELARGHMDNLRFSDAAKLLATHQR